MPSHVGYGRKVGDGSDPVNQQVTNEKGQYAKGSVNPESERTENGENGAPRKEDYATIAEYYAAFFAWKRQQKKPPVEEPPVEEPPVEEVAVEPEPEQEEKKKADNELHQFFVDNDVIGLPQWEAKKKADETIRELSEKGNFSFASSFDNFVDQRIRLACVLALKKVSEDYDLKKTGYGKIDIRTHKNNYYGDTKTGYHYKDNKLYLNGNWIIISSGASEPKSSSWRYYFKDSESNKWKGMANGDMDYLLGKYHDDQKTGFHDECSDTYVPFGTMVHEYGHNVQFDVTNRLIDMGLAKSWRDGCEYIVNQIRKKALDMFPEEYNNDIANVRNDVSKYGRKNSREFFAETFESMYSDKPRKVALAMREVLKLYF